MTATIHDFPGCSSVRRPPENPEPQEYAPANLGIYGPPPSAPLKDLLSPRMEQVVIEARDKFKALTSESADVAAVPYLSMVDGLDTLVIKFGKDAALVLLRAALDVRGLKLD